MIDVMIVIVIVIEVDVGMIEVTMIEIGVGMIDVTMIEIEVGIGIIVVVISFKEILYSSYYIITDI